MRALVLDGPPRVVDDRPRPPRAAGEARLSLRVAGVCDTDLALAAGYMGFKGVPGHEMVGRVTEADEAGWVGRRVVADINAGCGRCQDCTERDGHHCASRTVLGILGRDGAFAEELVMPSRCLVSVPDDVDDARAVFAEPLAAALHVLDALPARVDGPVVVLGDGKLGLLISWVLAAEGHDPLLVGHHDEKLALARAVGVRTTLERDLAAVSDAAVVVEATGSSAGLSAALSLARPRSRVILKTTVAGRTDVDLSPIVINELEVVGSRCGNVARAIAWLAEGRVDPTPLIVARYPLARADEAMAHAARKGTLKVLIEADDE